MSQQSGLYPIGSGTFANVPRPSKNNLTFFLNANDRNRLYVMAHNGSVQPVFVNSDNVPFGNDTNAAANTVTVTIPKSLPLVDGYLFEVRILTTNTGAVVMNLDGVGNKAVVSTAGAALSAGDLVSTSTYLFYYDLANDRYVNLGLAQSYTGGPLTNGHIFVGNASNEPTDVAVTGDVTITNAGVTAITAGAIINTDINAAAAIAYSKLAALPSGDILVGSAGNVATPVVVSKDATLNNLGALTVVGLQGNTVLASTPDIGGALVYDGTFWGSNPVSSLLFTLIGANFNSTADQVMVGPILAGTAFIITDLIIKNASVSLTTADTLALWSGAAQTGSLYLSIGTGSIAKLTSNTTFISALQEGGRLSAGDAIFYNDVAGTSVIFSLGTAQGAAATADVLVFGYVLG